MAVTIQDAERLEGADVFDERGEFIGTVRGPHILDGELVGVTVDLDERLAELPTVARDSIQVAPQFLELSGKDAVRVRMGLMEAVEGRAPPHRREGE